MTRWTEHDTDLSPKVTNSLLYKIHLILGPFRDFDYLSYYKSPQLEFTRQERRVVTI